MAVPLPTCGHCNQPLLPRLYEGVKLDVCEKCDRVSLPRTALEALCGTSLYEKTTPAPAHAFGHEPTLGNLVGAPVEPTIRRPSDDSDQAIDPEEATRPEPGRDAHLSDQIGTRGISFGKSGEAKNATLLIGIVALIFATACLSAALYIWTTTPGPELSTPPSTIATEEDAEPEVPPAHAPDPTQATVGTQPPPETEEHAVDPPDINTTPPLEPIIQDPIPTQPDPTPASNAAPTADPFTQLIDAGWSTVETRPDTAADQFQRALAIRPRDPEANYGYGYALLKQGNAERATSHLCVARTGDEATKRDVTGLLLRHDLSCD